MDSGVAGLATASDGLNDRFVLVDALVAWELRD